MSNTVDRTCPHCGTQYQVDPERLKHGRRLYCTRACAFAAKQDPSKIIEGPCIVCGTQVRKYTSLAVKSKAAGLLCSPACHYKARSLGHSKRVVAKPYQWTPEGKEAIKTALLANNAKRKAEGRYGHTEATKRRISESLLKRKTVGQAKQPRPAPTGRKRSQGHSDETKQKLSEAQARAMASGKIPRISKLEQDVGKLLVKLGYRVQPQFLVRGEGGRYIACCDYYLPDLNLAVEVNGTYWHADPRVYPQGPSTPSQKRTCEKYAVKMAALAERGIRVAEVWEIDFKADPEGAVKAAVG